MITPWRSFPTNLMCCVLIHQNLYFWSNENKGREEGDAADGWFSSSLWVFNGAAININHITVEAGN